MTNLCSEEVRLKGVQSTVCQMKDLSIDRSPTFAYIILCYFKHKMPMSEKSLKVNGYENMSFKRRKWALSIGNLFVNSVISNKIWRHTGCC